MERLLAMYRVTSSSLALVLLVGFNLVPLAGVVWWGWDLWTILVLYWVENGIIGALNVAKILTAQGTVLPGLTRWRMNGRPVNQIARGGIAAFFTIHYGVFWLGHGVFVLLALPLIAGVSSGSGSSSGDTLFGTSAGPGWGLLQLGAIGLALSHGASFGLNYIGRGEYRTTSPIQLMLAPYGRVVVLHLTIILGATVSIALGTPIGALVVLVTIKTLLDVAFHLREHRRATVQEVWAAT
ncbi:MAG: DUF6498-containing protein [Chloroflexota bacterium]|nr:DUF6498-containing protein [Chloroflexota bacterium]